MLWSTTTAQKPSTTTSTSRSERSKERSEVPAYTATTHSVVHRHSVHQLDNQQFCDIVIVSHHQSQTENCSCVQQAVQVVIFYHYILIILPSLGGLEFHPGQDYYFISLTRYCTTAKQQVIEFEITISIDDDIWPCRSNIILQLVFALASND